MKCLRPKLTKVPKGDWFCQRCAKVKNSPRTVVKKRGEAAAVAKMFQNAKPAKKKTTTGKKNAKKGGDLKARAKRGRLKGRGGTKDEDYDSDSEEDFQDKPKVKGKKEASKASKRSTSQKPAKSEEPKSKYFDGHNEKEFIDTGMEGLFSLFLFSRRKRDHSYASS